MRAPDLELNAPGQGAQAPVQEERAPRRDERAPRQEERAPRQEERAPPLNAKASQQEKIAEQQLRFDAPVSSNGYRWWYVDAFTPDGKAGLTIIGFVGSVFSPYYARARRKGLTDPEHFVSLNVIFYGPDRKRWALTERGRTELTRSANYFQVGPSAISREPDGYRITIDERCVPWPSAVKGQVIVRPRYHNTQCFALDPAGRHRWWPIAPRCDVEVSLTSPNLKWRGEGYMDSNGGSEPVEQGFTQWHWMRSTAADGSGIIYYDVLPTIANASGLCSTRDQDDDATCDTNCDKRHDKKSGNRLNKGGNANWRGLTVQSDIEGRISDGSWADPGPPAQLPVTPVWRMPRPARAELSDLQVVKTYEDTPFYTRSQLTMPTDTGSAQVMHESLDLKRFGSRWVQTLLPFRMPRRSGW